jgi:hypothetical protein
MYDTQALMEMVPDIRDAIQRETQTGNQEVRQVAADVLLLHNRKSQR